MPIIDLDISDILNNQSNRIQAEILDNLFNKFYDYLNNKILNEILALRVSNSIVSVEPGTENCFYRDNGTGLCTWTKLNVKDFLVDSISYDKILKPENFSLLINNGKTLDFFMPYIIIDGAVVMDNDKLTTGLLTSNYIADATLSGRHIPDDSLKFSHFKLEEFFMEIPLNFLTNKNFSNKYFKSDNFLQNSMKNHLKCRTEYWKRENICSDGLYLDSDRKLYFVFNYFLNMFNNNNIPINDIKMLCVYSDDVVFNKFKTYPNLSKPSFIANMPPIQNRSLSVDFKLSENHFAENGFSWFNIIPKTMPCSQILEKESLSWCNLHFEDSNGHYIFNNKKINYINKINKKCLPWVWQEKIGR